jgi:uncharacterized membrane protein YhaH (DUF805 family)
MAATPAGRARRTRLALVALFLIGIPVQFYLAGRGVFGAGTYDAHKGVGDAMHMVTVLALVVTFFGADMRNQRDVALAVGLAVLMTIQAIIPSFDHPNIGALHPLNAILLLGLAVHLVMRDRAALQATQPSNSV